jgi:hypothetical protein
LFPKEIGQKEKCGSTKTTKINIEQQECDKKPGMTSAAPEG